jgi:hypothetical protein
MRPVLELVTKIAGDVSCQKLSSLNWFNFESLLIAVRSGPHAQVRTSSKLLEKEMQN